MLFVDSGRIIMIENRKAFHNYELIKSYTAGIKLVGEEVKSLRMGKGNIAGSYVSDVGGELYLVGFNIPRYPKSSNPNYNSKRLKKLLLNQKEVREIKSQIINKGRTAVPTRIYLKKDVFKADIVVVKGLGKPEKKEHLKEEQIKRDIDRELKDFRSS